ncbi:hypothetical protein [Rhizobium sp. 21-4511-3d]
MNQCGFGSFKRPTGFIAWIRLYHHGENRILRDGRDDIIFPSEQEAEAAAKDEFLRQMNSPIVSEAITGPTTKRALAKSQLERLFRGGGKTVEVERKETAA